jgi:hypothetical protein
MNYTIGSGTLNVGKGYFHNDYAGNAGDQAAYLWGKGQTPAAWPGVVTTQLVGDSGFDCSQNTGVVFQQSHLAIAEIKDGTSNTYLVGEKYLNPDYYTTGTDIGDDDPCLGADDLDLNRWSGGGTATYTSYPPIQDQSGVGGNDLHSATFGSAHAAGFNVVLCDGSVRTISYSIDTWVHKNLANRKDGNPIDGSKL